MPKLEEGGIVFNVPDVLVFDGEEIPITKYDVKAVMDEHAEDGDEPIGAEVHLELPNQGTVIFSIVQDGYGDTEVFSGPISGNTDDVDTLPEPPASFVDQVYIARADEQDNY